MRIAVASAKGSPGATCFALALAVVWPRPVVLVEADPAGGDLGGRFGVPDHPGLASLVVAARRDGGPDLWNTHANQLPVGADVVIAPAAARQADAAVAGLAAHVPDAQVDLIFDVGRLAEASPAWPLVSASDELLVVSGNGVASIDHTAALTSQQQGERPHWSVVLVGDLRFSLSDVSEVLGVPVLASVPTDGGTAAVLTGAARPGRVWSRFGIPAAARTAALQLVPGTTPAGPPAQQPPRRAVRLRVPAFTRGDTP